MFRGSRVNICLVLSFCSLYITLVFAQFANSLEFCKFGYIHKGCLPFNCTHDIECHEGSPGHYSRCRVEFGRCECFHKNRPGVAINNTCLPVKTEGELCTSDLDCKSIRGQSACLGIPTTDGIRRGICGCKNLRDYYHEGLNECLKLQSTEGSSCQIDIQCSHPRALGLLSVCEKESRSCRCWDTVNGGVEPTGWHAGRCYYSRSENESCDLREECVVGFHPNADCLWHESYKNETVCVCPENENCEEPDEDQSDAARFSANTVTSIKYNSIKGQLICLIIVVFVHFL